PHRRRWRRRILLALLILLPVLGIAEYFASRHIAQKLCDTVAQKLDAKLTLGPLIYLPPYGAIAWNAELKRESATLISVARIKLRLAEFPTRGKPLLISSLTLNTPDLSAFPGAFTN